MFYAEARKYIVSLIKQRMYMAKNHIQQNPVALCAAEKLNKYLSFYAYNNNCQMAKFFINHSGDIMQLIPGGKNKNAESYYQKFMNLSREAQNILHYEQ
jgi:hypothetical protein